MSTKDEFYRKLDAVVDAATEALKAMPENLPPRDKKLWLGILSRLPEQIPDVKNSLDDPHVSAMHHRQELSRKFGIIE